MNTSTKLETKVKRLTKGEYFVEDAKGGLLAKTWREDVANQIIAALNGKDIDLLNGKAGEILNAQLDELAALRAENAKLRDALESIDALVAEDMGDWYSVQFAHLPASLANLAHIRDAIQDTFEAINVK